MTKKILLTLCILFVYDHSAQSQNPAPAKPQTKKILLTGGTTHIGNSQVIENGAIGFENGKLNFVGPTSSVTQTSYDTIINCSGKNIYPGFIGMNTTMGLAEIGAARATLDMNEVGDLNPSSRVIISYNTDSKVIPTVRCDGVLMCQVVPVGGLISGQSSVVELDAWNWEDAVYKTDEGIHLNWPVMRLYRSTNAPPVEEQQSKTQKTLQRISELFKDARAYYETDSTQEINLNLEAMKGLFNGTKKIYVHCNTVHEIIVAVNFFKEQKIKMVLVGGDESWRVTDLLRENKIPVVLENTHSLPLRDDEDIQQPFKTPYLLQQAGVDFCIAVDGYWQVRTLGFNAGTAVNYGLTKEQALASVTSSPAKILGIDKSTGTLEVGKDATLFISKGDALDMLGNKVDAAFIRGKAINLDNVQKQLYRKYLDKYGLKE